MVIYKYIEYKREENGSGLPPPDGLKSRGPAISLLLTYVKASG